MYTTVISTREKMSNRKDTRAKLHTYLKTNILCVDLEKKFRQFQKIQKSFHISTKSFQKILFYRNRVKKPLPIKIVLARDQNNFGTVQQVF